MEIPNTQIRVLQQGQCALFSSHGTRHVEWKRWAQGKCARLSLSLNCSKHTAHSSCSEDFQLLNLAQLITLFDALFFNPPAAVVTAAEFVWSWSTTLTLSWLFLLLGSDFLYCALSLSSSLSLASLATPPSFSSWLFTMLLFWRWELEIELRRELWLLVYKQREERLVEFDELPWL